MTRFWLSVMVDCLWFGPCLLLAELWNRFWLWPLLFFWTVPNQIMFLVLVADFLGDPRCLSFQLLLWPIVLLCCLRPELFGCQTVRVLKTVLTGCCSWPVLDFSLLRASSVLWSGSIASLVLCTAMLSRQGMGGHSLNWGLNFLGTGLTLLPSVHLAGCLFAKLPRW